MEKIFLELNERIPKWNINLNEPMSKHTTIKIGGIADYFVEISTIEELKWALEVAKRNNLNVYVIGNGSNLLVRDEGVRGIVIKSQLKNIEFNKEEDYVDVTVGSGMMLPSVVNYCLENKITGFEFTYTIPGTIGGAVRMNSGAHGKEMKDVVLSTTYMDLNGELYTISNKEHEFKHRDSIFGKHKNSYIIVESTLRLSHGTETESKLLMNKYETWRKENRSESYPSSGSALKRGSDFATSVLIDKAGLRGYRIGGAQVSEEYAGFIINAGGATTKDILDLIDYVKKVIYEKFGKEIDLESDII